MKEYMLNLGSVMMLMALSRLILPEGGIRKFATLAMGFMLITAALSPLPSDFDDISFTPESFEISESELEKSEAQYRAQVIKTHRENLKKLIEENMSHGGSASVEVTEDGEIISVTLRVKGDESSTVNYIVNTLAVPRERIKLIYDKN